MALDILSDALVNLNMNPIGNLPAIKQRGHAAPLAIGV
jgi:hypothetical protein